MYLSEENSPKRLFPRDIHGQAPSRSIASRLSLSHIRNGLTFGFHPQYFKLLILWGPYLRLGCPPIQV